MSRLVRWGELPLCKNISFIACATIGVLLPLRTTWHCNLVLWRHLALELITWENTFSCSLKSNGSRKPNVPSENASTGGAILSPNIETLCKMVPSPPSVTNKSVLVAISSSVPVNSRCGLFGSLWTVALKSWEISSATSGWTITLISGYDSCKCVMNWTMASLVVGVHGFLVTRTFCNGFLHTSDCNFEFGDVKKSAAVDALRLETGFIFTNLPLPTFAPPISGL